MTTNATRWVTAVARWLLAALTAVATFYFVFWICGAFLQKLALPRLLLVVVSVGIATVLAVTGTRYLLRRPAEGVDSAQAALKGALATGSIAFAVGFFGPMVLSPQSNQGPILGFVLGPAGFVVGAVGGAWCRTWPQHTREVARAILAWSTVLSLVIIVAVGIVSYRTQAEAARREWGSRRGVEATGDSVMVVSASPLASQVGVQILRAGGNAVDAAVGVAFALAVTYPTAGNIGGGGLMLARMNGQAAALDFREVAPLKATPDMYLDANGNVTDRSVTGALAVGVPGSVAGLWAAHGKFGALPWRDVVQPAIDLAEKGFPADAAFREDVRANLSRFNRSHGELCAPNGPVVELNARCTNPTLAHTLRLIAEQGAKGFYEGETAEKIVAEMTRGDGIVSMEDLRRYEAKWRIPVEFTYRGYRVLTMPPVSSGGLTFALIAGILEGFNLRAMGFHSTDAIHVMAEAERLAYERRNTLLADPDFVSIPTASFLSPDTIAVLRRAISMTTHAGAPVAPDPVRGRHTTHFAVVDNKGNAVSLTTTLNTGFGSAVTVTGAGFVLNNEMDDFTTKVGAVNQMGLRQGAANAIAPGKRMLSSMTPTIVLDSTGATFLVVGAAGGARIITAVAQIVSDVIDFRMPIGAALAAPRFHAQDYPDRLEMALEFPDSTARALKMRGHQVERGAGRGWNFGWAQGILRSEGRWHGATEPRGHGRAIGY